MDGSMLKYNFFTNNIMLPIIIEHHQAFQKAISSKEPIVVVFYKVGCPYCIEVEPLMDELAEALAPTTKMYVMKVRSANKDEYKQAYGFSAFPRLAIFQGGKMRGLLNIRSEELTKERVMRWVEGYLA